MYIAPPHHIIMFIIALLSPSNMAAAFSMARWSELGPEIWAPSVQNLRTSKSPLQPAALPQCTWQYTHHARLGRFFSKVLRKNSHFVLIYALLLTHWPRSDAIFIIANSVLDGSRVYWRANAQSDLSCEILQTSLRVTFIHPHKYYLSLSWVRECFYSLYRWESKSISIIFQHQEKGFINFLKFFKKNLLTLAFLLIVSY